MTNPLEWKVATQIAAAAVFVGSVTTLMVGYNAALDWQPFFALKATVIADERRAAFNRIADLGIQLDYLREKEDRPTIGVAELGRVRDAIKYATEEKQLLECSFHYTACGP